MYSPLTKFRQNRAPNVNTSYFGVKWKVDLKHLESQTNWNEHSPVGRSDGGTARNTCECAERSVSPFRACQTFINSNGEVITPIVWISSCNVWFVLHCKAKSRTIRITTMLNGNFRFLSNTDGMIHWNIKFNLTLYNNVPTVQELNL
jgi:hypothetical protein